MAIPMVPDDPDWPADAEVLHIVAQYAWHDPAFICGTAEGLIRLRDAINRALASPESTQEASVFANDGEGYGVHVRCEPARKMHLMPLGYTASDMGAVDNRPWPHWMTVA